MKLLSSTSITYVSAGITYTITGENLNVVATPVYGGTNGTTLLRTDYSLAAGGTITAIRSPSYNVTGLTTLTTNAVNTAIAAEKSATPTLTALEGLLSSLDWVITGNAVLNNAINPTATKLSGTVTWNLAGGNDSVTAGSGVDSLVGGDGNDVLNGGGGNDYLSGGNGNDSLTGGNDTLIDDLWGGAGNDVFRIGAATGMDKVQGNAGTDTVLTTGLFFGLTGQTLSQIEVLQSSTAGATLAGTTGNDLIGLGDIFSADGATQLVDSYTIDGYKAIQGDAGNDQITGGTAAETITGGSGNDTLVGDRIVFDPRTGLQLVVGGSDVINGGTDNDSIDGGIGNDALNGDAGIDTLLGGDGNDTLNGGVNAGTTAELDSLNGGLGNDTFIVSDATGADTIVGGNGTYTIAGVTKTYVDTVLTSGKTVSAATLANISGIEIVKSSTVGAVLMGGNDSDAIGSSYTFAGFALVSGGAGNDTITGSTLGDSLAGGTGNDTLWGRDGSDNLKGDENNDTLWGDDGNDAVTTVGSGNDILNGGAGLDTLWGEDGNDTLDGGVNTGTTGEIDTLNGGLGNDTFILISGAGADVISGGNGTYTSAGVTKAYTDTVLVTGHLTAPTTTSLQRVFNFADLAAAKQIELVKSSTSMTTLVGTSGDDRIGDDDEIDFDATTETFKVSGFTTINGAGGNDVIIGSDNGETILGGDGTDQLTGLGGSDTLKGEAGVDTLKGDTGNDTLDGGAAADALEGGDGNDTLNGGVNTGTTAELDSLNGGLGNDTFIVSDATGADTIVGGDGTYQIGTETKTYVDTVLAAGSAFSIATLANASGIEIVKSTTYGSTFNGSANGDSIGTTGTYALQNFMYINGAAGNDIINGSALGENLLGGTGNDTLDGLGGADNVYGDDGNDTLRGDAGNDSLNGGLGNDTLTGGVGVDELVGEGGNDIFVFTVADMGVGTTADLISDFETGIDKVDLRGLSLVWTTTDFVAGSGNQVRFASGVLSIDNDAEADVDFAIRIQNDGLATTLVQNDLTLS